MPDRLPEGDKTSPRPQPPVAEREPLTIVVIDAPPAEQALTAPATADVRVRTGTDVEAAAQARRRRWTLALLLAAAAVLLVSTYRRVFEPLAVRFAHGIERRVLSAPAYNALHEHTARHAKPAPKPHGKHEKRRAKVTTDSGT